MTSPLSCTVSFRYRPGSASNWLMDFVEAQAVDTNAPAARSVSKAKRTVRRAVIVVSTRTTVDRGSKRRCPERHSHKVASCLDEAETGRRWTKVGEQTWPPGVDAVFH